MFFTSQKADLSESQIDDNDGDLVSLVVRAWLNVFHVLGFITALLLDASSKNPLRLPLIVSTSLKNKNPHDCSENECFSVIVTCLVFFLVSLGVIYIFADIKLPSDDSRASE